MSILPTRSFERVLVVVVVVLAARPLAAHADADVAAEAGAGPGSAATTIADLNRKALDDYDNLNFDDAKTALKNALALCDRNGLGSDPVRAQTYLNLGVVLLAADAQHRDVAIANLRRAIQIQADIQLPERLANPEVQAGLRRGAGIAARHAGDASAGSHRRRRERAPCAGGPRGSLERRR